MIIIILQQKQRKSERLAKLAMLQSRSQLQKDCVHWRRQTRMTLTAKRKKLNAWKQ